MIDWYKIPMKGGKYACSVTASECISEHCKDCDIASEHVKRQTWSV
jgi:hypothetical protein